MKKTGLCYFLVILLIFASSAFAQTPEVTNGLNYLSTVQNPDGSWGGSTAGNEVMPTTVAAIETMQQLGETSSQNYIDALAWLEAQSIETTDYLSGRIHALSSPGMDQDALLSYLDTVISDAWGGYDAHEANNLDTSLALQALGKTDYADFDTVAFAFAYLIDNQNLDGGFGFYPGDDSNTYITAIVLRTFAAYNGIFDFQQEVNETAAYLLSKQNPDGGFGSSPSTVYETALAFIALTESGQGGAQSLQDAQGYIETTQMADGSWNGDPFESSLALQALADVKPDLTIYSSDITLSNANPVAGDTITITVNIRNLGPLLADNVTVAFYDGDPANGGLLIGEVAMPAIPAFGSAAVDMNWTTSSSTQSDVFVDIDPLNTIEEIFETNNSASRTIHIGSGPNIVISDIIFTPETAIIGQPTDMSFVIENRGDTFFYDVPVEYHHAEGERADVIAGTIDEGLYSKVAETTIPELAPGATFTINTQMTLAMGYHDIKVTADPGNIVLETNEDDNVLNKWTASLYDKADLVINRNIIVSPREIKENDDIVVLAQVANVGGVTANGVNVSIYDGDPDMGGIKLDEFITDMEPLDHRNVEFHLSLLQGQHELHILVDPDGAILEYDIDNNRAMKAISVDMASYVDFVVTEGDMVFSPQDYLPGDVITLSADVHNLETQAESTTVSFYEGNPAYGGTKIHSETVTISGGGTVNVNAPYRVPEKYAIIFVVVDEDDLVYEKRELNNRAFKSLSTGLPDLMVRDKDIKINRMSDGSIYISPLIRNLGGIEATAVSVTLYDGDPAAGGTLITEELIDLIPAGAGQRINVPYTLTSGRHNIYVTADPANSITEIFEGNNSGMKVVYKTDPNGPDIVITAIDSSGVTTDTQLLTVTGSLNVTLENQSLVDAAVPFMLTAYEDKNRNALYDEGIDNKLGEALFESGLPQSGSTVVAVGIGGMVEFWDNHIHVMADSGDVITEYSEDNNNRHHKEDCKITPVPVEGFEVVEKWAWFGGEYEPANNQVRMSPMVANMNDDNGDGIVDEDDIPDVIFVTHEWMNYGGKIILRVISGKDGTEIWNAEHPDKLAQWLAGISIGDIDNDGFPEVVTALVLDRNIVAYNHDGTLLWTSEYYPLRIGGYMALIADIDNDGNPDIFKGRVMFDSKGQKKWDHFSSGMASMGPIAADLNNDDAMEIVSSNYVFNNDGTMHWNNPISMAGFNSISNFDSDPEPEIAYSGIGRLVLMGHDKAPIWTFNEPEYRYELKTAPSIGDVDGDGTAELVVAGNKKLTLFDSDGTLRWEADLVDNSGGVIAPALFDLNGDGAFEIVINDGDNFFIFNGNTGQVLFQTQNDAATFHEIPAIADVDNDGNVELVTFGGMHSWGDPYYGGIRVFGEKNGNWVSSRRIWNQHSYHVTNVDEDGYVPLREEDSWKKYNCYRCNVPIADPLDTPDLTVSKLMVSENGFPEHVIITARIGNAGTLLAGEGADISFYDGDPAAGGVLIGTASTVRILNPGEYQDISLTWYYPSSGSHHIYVVADPSDKLKECDETNNEGWFTISLGELPLPDLSVISSDMAIAPAPVVEGQSAIISVVVNNPGQADAPGAELAIYDGDPASGGILIGSVKGLDIVSGTGATADVSWETMGKAGIHYIYAVADPQGLVEESNEQNNTALVQVEVVEPSKPDITATSADLVFSTGSPTEGDSLTLNVMVHNNGIAAGAVTVNLYDGEIFEDGYIINPIIPCGGQEQVVFEIDTVGKSGSHMYTIVLDPNDTIVEENEENNTVSAELVINSIELNLNATTDKIEYVENEDAVITVNITDLLGSARDLLVDAAVYDASGMLAGTVPEITITVDALGTGTLNLIWNTENTLAGDYDIRVTAYDTGDNALARQIVPITISSALGLSAHVTLDKVAYRPNDNVEVTARVTNNSLNRIFENITAVTIIKDSTGQVLTTDSRTFTDIAPTSLRAFRTYWDTGVYPAGAYGVEIMVMDGSTILAAASNSITISSTFDPSALLVGDISVDTQSLLQGDPVNISYSVTNVGNIDLSLVDLSILAVHVTELTAYDTMTDQMSLPMGSTYSAMRQLDTSTYSAKDYLVILRANIEGEEGSLGSTYFRVEGAPSSPSLNWPGHGEDVETAIPTLMVNNSSDPNDDRLTYEFELYADSGLTTLITSESGIAEGVNSTSWAVPAELDENSIYAWRVRAYDGMLYGDWMFPAAFRVNVENDVPTAPSLSSPVDGSEADTFTPVLTVNNASDPDSADLVYNFEVALDQDFINIVASEYGVTEGSGTTSWQVTVPLDENITYYWRVQADDWLIEGPWMAAASFFVNTSNEAPTAPNIVNPTDGSEIPLIDTDVTAAGANDPDLDSLFYYFEADSSLTFDSSDLRASGDIVEGAVETIWSVKGLLDNTTYYVRANAHDGLIDSPWSGVVSFFVNTVNDPPGIPVKANPSDGGAVNIFNPPLSIYNAVDIDGDSLTYDYEIYKDAGMVNLVASVNGIAETVQTTEWTVPVALSENSTYYWRARAYDGVYQSAWTGLSSFMVNTANDSPSAPVLNGPAEGSSIETMTPTLSILNATDPDTDVLTYDFEIYVGDLLVDSIMDIAENNTGITSASMTTELDDNTTYSWRARAYDGDRYGPWMDLGTFSIHLPVNSITATIDFRPRTLNKMSNGRWVVVYIELPDGYNVRDIDRSSIRIEGLIPAVERPYRIGDHDHDGIEDLMVKFKRSDVIAVLPEGDDVPVTVEGNLGALTFEGVDSIRVIPALKWRHIPPHRRCKSHFQWKWHKSKFWKR